MRQPKGYRQLEEREIQTFRRRPQHDRELGWEPRRRDRPMRDLYGSGWSAAKPFALARCAGAEWLPLPLQEENSPEESPVRHRRLGCNAPSMHKLVPVRRVGPML